MLCMIIWYKVSFFNSQVKGYRTFEECFPKLTQSTSTHFEIITFLFTFLFMESFWVYFNSKLLNTTNDSLMDALKISKSTQSSFLPIQVHV